jgi:type I restriction enzyme M protein
MDNRTKQAILEYVQKHDPKHDVVTLTPTADLSGGTVIFSGAMRKHRDERNLKGEKYVEAYLAVKLVKELGYPVGQFELQKEYPAGHPKTDRPRIDVSLHQPLETGTQRLFLFVEAKDPDKYAGEREQAIQSQLYPLADHERINNLKYLMYFSVEFNGVSLAEKIDIIDFEQFPDHESWKAAGKPTLDLIPSDYGLARKAVYVNKPANKLKRGEQQLDRRVGPVEFAALRNDLQDVLWGGGGMFYNDIFSNLVKIFLAKIYDEETTPDGKPYTFQIQFIGGKPESPTVVYEKVDKLFSDAQKHYLGYSDAQATKSKGIDTERIAESKVAYVVERLQGVSLIENESPGNGDVLGSFFEGIVENGFKQSRGQFFTHVNIVHFLIEALRIPQEAIELVGGKDNPAKPRLPFICDPACGSGTFLIETMKQVTKAVQKSPDLKRTVRNRQFLESMFPPSKPNRWADVYVYGVEINPDLSLATKVNMVLHGDGNINVYCKDGLADFREYVCQEKVSAFLNVETIANFGYKHEVNQQFDFVLTNPPFSIKPDKHTQEGYRKRFDFGTAAKSESLFLERWYQILKEGGKVGAVLPESVFDTPSGVPLRLFLYRYFEIEAIVSLPYLAFKPYTSTKTCLFIARKKARAEVEKFDRLWKSSMNRYRKILRRIGPYLNKQSRPAIEEAIEQIGRSSEEDRLHVAHFIGLQKGDGKSIAARLYQSVNEGWTPMEEDQWVFSQVAAELNYAIFFAEAEEVGYKRRKQGGDLIRPNSLFRTDDSGVIVRDCDDPESVLEKLLSRNIGKPSLSGFLSDFACIGRQRFLRCDPKYRWFWDHMDGKVVPKSKYEFKPLSHWLSVGPKIVVKKGELPEERNLIELEDVEGGTGHILGVHPVDEVGSDKIEFGGCDIVFSKLEPYLCKAFLNDPEAAYIGSTEWVPLVVHDDVAIKEYLWAFLVSPTAKTVFRLLQSGKRHARINLEDFLNIRLPEVPKPQQVATVKAMKPDWDRMAKIRKELGETRDSVNKKLANSITGK